MNPSTRDTAFHLHLTRDTPLGRYCILPGDPGRCAAIAARFDNPVHRQTNREYCTWTGALLGQPVSGLIVEGSRTALPNPNLDLYGKLDMAGIPYVFLHGGYAALPEAVCVSDDNFGGGYLLARHLITQGHTKIAGIFKSDDVQGHQRYLGCLSALRDAGLPIPDDRVLWYATEERRYLLDYGHTGLLEHFIQFYLKDCTAVVCYNDEVAVKLEKALLSQGLRVPQDKAIISFDNSQLGELASVGLTSFAHPKETLGACAARKLIAMLDGRKEKSTVMDWDLIQRKSV